MSAMKDNVTPKEIIDKYHFANKKAFEDLSNLLTEEDIKAMAESSDEFREKFTFA